MSLRAPTVRRGQRLTAELWNATARAINQGLAAPRDGDAGIFADEVAGVVELELERATTSVRVFNPDDAEQYVDLDRITSLTVRNKDTGIIKTTYFAA